MNANLNRHYYVFFGLALCSLIAPLWLVEVPPLVDLPNHLARVFILAHYGETPFFQQNFQIIYEPIPNLAIDLIVVPMLNLFDIWTANHLFLTLTVILFAFGCHLVSFEKNGSLSFSAIFAMFLIYSGTFFYGFVNYVFGVALFLITFGLWLRWREKFRFSRFLALIWLTFAIYLAHLSAFVFFGAAVFVVNIYDLINNAAEKRKLTSLVADCAFFVLPIIAFLSFMGSSGNVGAISWNSLSGKAIALFGAFRSYDLWLDLIVIMTIAMFCFWLKRKGNVVFDKKILIVVSVFLLLFLVSPKVLFTSSAADARFVLPAFVLLILSCRVEVFTKKALALFIITVCLLAFRQVVISYRWIQITEKMMIEKNLLSVIAPESRVYPLFFNEGSGFEEKSARPIEHTVNFVTIQNSSFAPTLFALAGQQPLVFRQAQEFSTLANDDKNKWMQSLNGYDYVWTFNVSQSIIGELQKRAEIVAESEKTKIWKLNKH